MARLLYINKLRVAPLCKGRQADMATRTATASSADSDCCICISSLVSEQSISSTPCGHVFHTECISACFSHGSDRCPMCKTPIYHHQVHRLYISFGAGVQGAVLASSPSTDSRNNFSSRAALSSTEEHNPVSHALQRQLDELKQRLRDETAKRKYELEDLNATVIRVGNQLSAAEAVNAEHERQHLHLDAIIQTRTRDLELAIQELSELRDAHSAMQHEFRTLQRKAGTVKLVQNCTKMEARGAAAVREYILHEFQPGSGDEHEPESELEFLRVFLGERLDALADATARNATLLADITSLRSKSEELEGHLSVANRRLFARDRELAKKSTEVADLEKEIAATRALKAENESLRVYMKSFGIDPPQRRNVHITPRDCMAGSDIIGASSRVVNATATGSTQPAGPRRSDTNTHVYAALSEAFSDSSVVSSSSGGSHAWTAHSGGESSVSGHKRRRVDDPLAVSHNSSEGVHAHAHSNRSAHGSSSNAATHARTTSSAQSRDSPPRRRGELYSSMHLLSPLVEPDAGNSEQYELDSPVLGGVGAPSSTGIDWDAAHSSTAVPPVSKFHIAVLYRREAGAATLTTTSSHSLSGSTTLTAATSRSSSGSTAQTAASSGRGSGSANLSRVSAAGTSCRPVIKSIAPQYTLSDAFQTQATLAKPMRAASGSGNGVISSRPLAIGRQQSIQSGFMLAKAASAADIARVIAEFDTIG